MWVSVRVGMIVAMVMIVVLVRMMFMSVIVRMIMMVVMVIVVVIMVVMMMIVRLALFPGSPRLPQGDRNDQHPGNQLEPGFGRVCIPAPTKP